MGGVIGVLLVPLIFYILLITESSFCPKEKEQIQFDLTGTKTRCEVAKEKLGIKENEIFGGAYICQDNIIYNLYNPCVTEKIPFPSIIYIDAIGGYILFIFLVIYGFILG